MKKNFRDLFFLWFSVFLLTFPIVGVMGAEEKGGTVTTIRYVAEDESIELPLDATDGLLKNATSSAFSFTTNSSTPLCRDLYKAEYDKDDVLIKKDLIDAEVILTDFSYKDGTFTCLYKNDAVFGIDQQKAIIFSLKSFPLYMKMVSGIENGIDGNTKLPISVDNLYNLFKGLYKPYNISNIKGYSKYGKVQGFSDSDTDEVNAERSNYSLYKRAKELGLLVPSNEEAPSGDEANFTVAQFVTALITLNTDVVKGVDENGNIIIDSDIQARMAFLKKDTGFMATMSSMSDKVINKISGWLGKDVKDNVSSDDTKEFTSAQSFDRYFDKKVFGLYYNFMNIGWGAVFSYGGLMAMGMIFLYSGSIVGFRYAMFRMEDSNKGKEFDFPFSNRLVAISSVFIMSFLHYPAGEATSLNMGEGDKTEMRLQTSLAKNMIGYLANTGATIADVASNNAIVVYMDYLFKATNTQSYLDIIANLNSNRRVIVEQALIQSFFKDNCVQPYKTNYEKYGSFSSATSHDDAKWKNIGSFNNKSTFFAKEGFISPLLCQTIELNLVLNRQYLESAKKSSEKMISNLASTLNSKTATTLAQVYVDTQLVGAKALGWFQASTLPVSHVFMLNSNIINNSYDGLNRATKGEAVTTAVISKTQDLYAQTGEEDLSEVLYDTDPTSGLGNFFGSKITSLLSYQVYNLLPQFSELRSFLGVIVDGASDKLGDLAMNIFPHSKIFSLGSSALKDYSKWKKKDKNDNKKKSSDKDKDTPNVGKNMAIDGVLALMSYTASFALAVIFYKLMMSAIFAGLITLLSILKICLYFWDVFIHYFVSPLIVAWQMTIQDKTDKVNAWAVDGFILYVFKPTLIVFSFFMYIISFEILMAIYGLIFDITFSSLDMATSFFEDSSTSMSLIVKGSLEGFSDVFVYVIGMILAYFIILKGDTMILDKFRYKDESDSGMANQLGEKMQQLSGARLT